MSAALAATILGWMGIILVVRMVWVERQIRAARREIRVKAEDAKGLYVTLEKCRHKIQSQDRQIDLQESTIQAQKEGLATMEARLKRIRTIAEGRSETQE